jgi:hypothetical protein
MGDKSPKNNAKAKKQKGDKQKAETAARVAAADARESKPVKPSR